jgi:predicted RNA binding protein YcfA (HicA-like mRNA interferase family)
MEVSMSKLTVVSSKDMVKILERLGFIEIRQKGSHKYFKHEDISVCLASYKDAFLI